MTGERNALMRQIQAYSFAITEVSLFLNNHPCDAAALEYYHKYSEMLAEAKETYEKNFGPITIHGVCSNDRWTWVDDPWPWEMDSAACVGRG